jgi:hypothetical protein
LLDSGERREEPDEARSDEQTAEALVLAPVPGPEPDGDWHRDHEHPAERDERPVARLVAREEDDDRDGAERDPGGAGSEQLRPAPGRELVPGKGGRLLHERRQAAVRPAI